MKNNSEIQILLGIIKEETGINLTDTDTGVLIALARKHKLSYLLHLFAQRNTEYFTGEQLAILEEQVKRGAITALKQLNELKNIAESFNSQNIPYLCIKGSQLARMLYGKNASKQSVDIDILLCEASDLEHTQPIMQNLGYTRSNLYWFPAGVRRTIFLKAKREVFFFNPKIPCSVDMHIRPGSNTYLTEKYFKFFLKNSHTIDLENTKMDVMNDECYLLYLCYHGALHRFSRLAWLVDIRTFLRLKDKSLDYQKLLDFAGECNIQQTVGLTFRLLKHYFEDSFSGELLYSNNRRMDFLVSVCIRKANSVYNKNGLIDRWKKFIYMMVLLKGGRARIDWIYGIIMRQVASLVAVKSN